MIWPIAVALTVVGPSLALTGTAGKLGAADAHARDAAARRLLAAGPAALHTLTAAAGSTDPEVRRRAAGLIDRIRAEQFTTPTLVVLHADRRPVAEAVADLARQTGYYLVLEPNGTTPLAVTLHYDRVPFWAAVDAVCAAAGLTPDVSDQGVVRLAAVGTADRFVGYAGPFRVSVAGVSSQRSRSFRAPIGGGMPDTEPEYVSFQLHLLAEPKAVLLGVGLPVVRAADDDTGLSLKPVGEHTAESRPTAHVRTLSHEGVVMIERRDRTAKAVRLLRGSVPVLLLTGQRPDVVLSGPLAKGKTGAGRTASLTVEDAATADGLYTVTLTVRAAGDPPDGWQDGLPQRLELTDAAGTVWPFAGVAAQSGDETTLRLTAQFHPPTPDAKPATLTLFEWRTAERDVAFEFRDLPLP